MSDEHPDLQRARVVRGAVLQVEGVADLDGGVMDSFATWRSGQRCAGVRLRPGGVVQLRVVADGLDALPDLPARVRAAVVDSGIEGAETIDVHLADVTLGEDHGRRADDRASDDERTES